MNVYISVVSHEHYELINKLNCLSELSEKFNVVVKSNTKNDKFELNYRLKKIHWINENYGLGFGENNNIIYKYCQDYLGMNNDDYFIVLNPDVIVNINTIKTLCEKMKEMRSDLAAINLFKDYNYSEHDNSIRNFPSLKQFIFSFLGLENTAIIDKNNFEDCDYVDWAAGSFLAFTSGHYARLSGFDERYFMYCEDIDICFRSKKIGIPVLYFPEIKAVHLAKHANRSMLSKHFFWHVKSVIRFLLAKQGLTNITSRLQ